ncbi:uncharacterized protein L3040_009528 [Drepanopeziza brunnea f. sp. 'multigermtubi']|uniref:Uncharacterized protein n=1 Tax=Marssonina brunnea f. sp. multigermtubi (strain MB_m1) TaxID=1072389 RepID=K1XUA8_MARBU|nr:uncharacterized protein MBM_05528 [Drepanopeziza brunnea f. sp. 'multigermtubi' MB_m1]EKD16234.1 hypothetical protein MBM_05528 [Drepanopeziza brunnea f. sp. 'multigermtubi' MB_m1]KAJ5032939.1 hypothetical protein L3040_009528 [Drepanopeziza brunnea f. sp. 'multigermtubi']
MKFIDATVAVAIFTASVAAAPSVITARQSLDIKLCRDANFLDCTNVAYQVDTCFNLDTLQGYDNTVTSFDTKGPWCKFFIDSNCQYNAGAFRWEGSLDDIAKEEPGMDNAFSSFECEEAIV